MLFRNILGMTTLSACLLFSGCAAQSVPHAEPFHLEPLGQAIPPSTARTALIDRIIADDPLVISSLKPVLKPNPSNDERIAALQKKSGFTLPDDYWALYKQNMEALQSDLAHQHDAARVQYIDVYNDQLSRVDESTLQSMANTPKALDEKTRRQWNARMADRLSQYIMTSEAAFNAATDAHLNRMAAMDRQYNVCARKPDCWDQPVKK
ncbi:MAG: hypothetical protein JWQ69_112 [Pseudomonas sp.]|nr:hypothetical protein [Pseudomonas sp.]